MALVDHAPFLGPDLIAFTSDSRIDFHKGQRSEGPFALTPPQSEWLRGAGILSPDRLVFPRQVHGDRIWRAGLEDGRERGVLEADAVVTDIAGLPIAVRTADCVPVLLFDPSRRVVAAVHAGWKSTRLQIVRKTVADMGREFRVLPADLRAVIGPCIRRESYSVGPEFRAYFPEDVSKTPAGLFFDIASANRRQLLAEGLRPERIMDLGQDTFSDRNFHSFRRDGERSGRMISVIMMRGV
ncbi:MAG: peptidoglycan editing factor PgeF [Elusimicrobia bacterium]|nr:peptidoglycan editing factor PgeF [Elusimicrobiota bacterium]